MNLIDGKKSKYEHGEGIGPQRVKPQRRDEQRFDEAVGEQIQRCEVLASVSEVLSGSIKMHGDEFVAIEGEIDFEKFQRDPIQFGRLDRPKHDAADGLQNAIDPLERDAGSKALAQKRTAKALNRWFYNFRGMDGFDSLSDR